MADGNETGEIPADQFGLGGAIGDGVVIAGKRVRQLTGLTDQVLLDQFLPGHRGKGGLSRAGGSGNKEKDKDGLCQFGELVHGKGLKVRKRPKRFGKVRVVGTAKKWTNVTKLACE